VEGNEMNKNKLLAVSRLTIDVFVALTAAVAAV